MPPDRLTTIVIVTYNRLEKTRLCVDSVEACTPEPHSLLFVDNGSADGTPEYLVERFGREAVIANETNQGFLRAANQGMAAAQGRYILLLNNDTVATPDWLGALLRAAESSPDVGIVGGRVVSPDGRVQVAGAYIAFDGSARMVGEGMSPDDPTLAKEREVCYVGGHCMLIRRELFERIGPLDEAFGFGYHEDTDYCYRARQAGYRVIYTPGCLVQHELHGTPLPERQEIINRNLGLIMERWGDRLFLERFIGPDLRFRADQGELPLGAGWYAAEEQYSCTSAEAWFYLAPSSLDQSLLELVAAASHPDLAQRPLHLEVLIQGQTAGHAFFRTPWELRQLFVPVRPTQGERLKVELKVDRTWRPDDLFRDGRDPREIGLAVHRAALCSPTEARLRAADSVPREASIQRLQDHLSFLEKAIVEKDAFYQRELTGKERLIAQLQGNLERYHATPLFRAYFALKRLLGR